MITPRQSSGLACACSTLRQASRAVSRHYEAHLAEAGITTTQFSILRCLEREGALPLSRMAEQLVLERTSLYRSLAPLEARGEVALRDDPEDRRARIATLTARGRRRIARILPLWEEAQASFLESVGPEWRTVASALARVIERMEGGAGHDA